MKKQQLNPNIQRQTLKRKQVKSLAAFIKNLPDKEVTQFIETQNQVERLLISRGINYAVADCFMARFLKGDDPIFHLKQKSKTSKLIYNMVWMSVNVYESLWSMIQISFQEIKQICEQDDINLPFFKAWDLFLEIIRIQENSVYSKCLHASCNTVNLNRDLTASKLIRKSVWSGLSDDEELQLNKLTKEQPVSHWLKIAYSLCKELSKKDTLIADHYNTFRRNIASTADLQVKIFSDSSKGRLEDKLLSSCWVGGVEYRGGLTYS